jgi:hypothetical protein
MGGNPALPFWAARGKLKLEMNRGFSVTQPSLSRLRLLAGLLAVVGQLGLLGAYLTLARDESSAISHTEQSGTNTHHGHNEATCAACTALSAQGTPSAIAQPVPTGEAVLHVLASAYAVRPNGPQLLSNSCRAPPREA